MLPFKARKLTNKISESFSSRDSTQFQLPESHVYEQRVCVFTNASVHMSMCACVCTIKARRVTGHSKE